MGGSSSTNKRVTRDEKQNAWLVVLHRADQETKNIKYLLDALNASPPEGNVDVDYDFKTLQIEDDGSVSEDITPDIKRCLEKDRIVLICFLANGKTQDLWGEIQNHQKVIMFRYREPEVDDEPLPQQIIMIDENFNTGGFDEMSLAVRELAKKILTKNNQ